MTVTRFFVEQELDDDDVPGVYACVCHRTCELSFHTTHARIAKYLTAPSTTMREKGESRRSTSFASVSSTSASAEKRGCHRRPGNVQFSCHFERLSCIAWHNKYVFRIHVV